MGVDSPSSVVELGCGPAKHSIEFSKRGIKATGVDRNEKMIEYAKENVRACLEWEKSRLSNECSTAHLFLSLSLFLGIQK